MEEDREKGACLSRCLSLLSLSPCLSLLSLSPSLKLLLIKQSEATEAGPFYAPCWDQRGLFGSAVGLANRIRDPRAGGLPSAWC